MDCEFRKTSGFISQRQYKIGGWVGHIPELACPQVSGMKGGRCWLPWTVTKSFPWPHHAQVTCPFTSRSEEVTKMGSQLAWGQMATRKQQSCLKILQNLTIVHHYYAISSLGGNLVVLLFAGAFCWNLLFMRQGSPGTLVKYLQGPNFHTQIALENISSFRP